MSDRDNITLPRELVEFVLKHLEWWSDDEPQEKEAIEVLRTALAAEPTKPSEDVEALRRENERLNAVALQAQNAAIDLTKKNERLREALRDTTVHLSAAVDLLKRGGRKATASDKMFGQMLDDYTNSFKRGRAALRREDKR